MVNMHKPQVIYPDKDLAYFNWTFGGLSQYRKEIAILSRNGYTHTEHDVTDRDGRPLTVGALHRAGKLVKVYEL